MIHPQRSVEIVHQLCKGSVKNPAEAYKVAEGLNNSALNEWDRRKLMADNESVVIGFFEHSVENSTLREEMHNRQSLQSPTLLCDEQFTNKGVIPHIPQVQCMYKCL